jgi:hypothetical protein
MSLTSYRAAPPRATIDVSICLRERLFRQIQKAARGGLCRHLRRAIEREDFNVRLADLAATYSPAS